MGIVEGALDPRVHLPDAALVDQAFRGQHVSEPPDGIGPGFNE